MGAKVGSGPITAPDTKGGEPTFVAGQGFWTDFNRAELRALAVGDDVEVEQAHVDIQSECFEDAVR